MAKVSKSMLKSIVKECLVEILAEGLLADDATSTLKESRSVSSKSKKSPRRSPRPALDQIRMERTQNVVTPVIPEVKDPVMASIFADTAANTFQTQVLAEQKSSIAQRMSHGDTATKTMAQNDPMAIFDGANNWAKLAFDK